MLLEFPVGTGITAITCIIITLSRHHPVQTPLPAVIGDVVVLDSCFLLGFGHTEAGFHLISFWQFFLTVNVDIFLQRCEVFETVPQVVESGLVVFQPPDHLSYKSNNLNVTRPAMCSTKCTSLRLEVRLL